MDPPTPASKLADKDFTPRELEIMAKAWNCMTQEPVVDFNKLADACGMTNPRSASNAWAGIKKKIQAKGGIDPAKKDGEGEGGATPKATPKRKKPGTPAKENGDAGGDGKKESPTKKPKATPKGKGKKKSEVKVEDEDEIKDGEEGDGSVFN